LETCERDFRHFRRFRHFRHSRHFGHLTETVYLEFEAGMRLRKQTARKTPQANEFARLMKREIFGGKFESVLLTSSRLE
jgi:hypothetical protein